MTPTLTQGGLFRQEPSVISGSGGGGSRRRMSPLAPTAKGVAEIAAKKTIKVLIWTVVIVAVRWILTAMFLP